MNTTDYFTNINAMFLFCIFTCGLLVWSVIRGYILKGKLIKEQDSHLKATKINSLLTKENKEIDEKLAQAEHKLRDAEKESRDLRKQLDHAEADRIELRAERATLENKLTDALAKVRKRDKDGKFLPSGNGRERRVKKGLHNIDRFESFKLREVPIIEDLQAIAAQPKLIHGLTVKNPTEDEAKMIFDAARRLRIEVSGTDKFGTHYPWIWAIGDNEITVCMELYHDSDIYVTAKEFVQRMQNGRG